MGQKNQNYANSILRDISDSLLAFLPYFNTFPSDNQIHSLLIHPFYASFAKNGYIFLFYPVSYKI